MKSYNISFISFFILLQCWMSSAVCADIVPLAERFNISSKILKEDRSYLVWKPNDYDPGKAYPVLYLLDGLDHLNYVAGAVDYFQSNNRIPPMLVVAIENTDRNRDIGFKSFEPGSSGAENFLAFLENELIPEINSSYSTQKYRLLVGHSAGGMFTLYALLNDPTLFNAYISVSGPLFWHEEYLVKAAETKAKELKDLPIDVFISLGDEDTDTIGAGLKLAAVLEMSVDWQEKYKERPLRWTYRHYPSEDHMSTIMPSVNEGLRTIFADWYMERPFELYEIGGFSGIEKHYKNVSRRMGYTVTPPYDTLRQITRILDQRERFVEAQNTMTKAIEFYPENQYAHYLLADIYTKQKLNDKAIEYFQLSLKLDPNFEAAKNRLQALKP